MDMAAEMIRSAITDDLEPAESALRKGDAAAVLTSIEEAIAKLNNALAMMESPERSHGPVGPIV